MQTKSTKTFRVAEPVQKVWLFLADLRKVAPCLPGAQITELVDDRTYKGTITVKIGPITTQLKGEVKIERLDQQNYEMELAGTGQDPRGGGGASLRMVCKLLSLPEGGTEVTGTTEVTVTGRIAQFGARMMDDVSNYMFEQFTKSFQSRLHQEVAESPASTSNPPISSSSTSTSKPPSSNPAPEPIKAIPLAFSVVRRAVARFFKSLFGRSAE